VTGEAEGKVDSDSDGILVTMSCRRNPKRRCRRIPDSDSSIDDNKSCKSDTRQSSLGAESSGDEDSGKLPGEDSSEEEENEGGTSEDAHRKAHVKRALEAVLEDLSSKVDSPLNLLELKEPMHILQRELIRKGHQFRVHDHEQYHEKDENTRNRMFAALQKEEERYLKESTFSG
jgi:hypothetical protein